ncbi:MAG: ATP-binding protein [Bacteroidales bacterium]|nr:ATP-binding protein [Bacteroidales bacterium]
MKFTSEGGVTLKASVEEHLEGRVLLEFSVADTGIGIAMEKLEEIFESYAQASADTTRKKSTGTGLGLAIRKRRSILQGGRISVTSEPEKGSVFTFSIVIQRSGHRSPESRSGRHRHHEETDRQEDPRC